MNGSKLVGGDTMNLWIDITRNELGETLKGIDILLINDGEAKMLAKDGSVPRAAAKVLEMGPKALVIKHGEYGATVFFRDGAYGLGKHPFRAPTLPLETVKDPTGAGDSFAGGFMGYLASAGEITRKTLKRAMFYGGVMGSFAVEDFGTRRLQRVTKHEIEERFKTFQELTHLD
jgi:sugar/nucleoside kinase (ribokinase family)